MLAHRHFHRLAAAVAAAALALVAACSKDSTAPADSQSELEGMTFSGDQVTPGLGMSGAFGESATTTCSPSVSPSPVVNRDGDRVPDSVRVTFPGCAFAEGDEADTVRGLIDVIDPTPTVTDRDVKLVFTDFTRIEVEDGRERSIVLNGTREATRDASVISQRETNFQTVYTFADGHTATSDRTWAITFMADVPGSIQPDAPLPSGTLSVGGTDTWTRDANTYSLTVSTDPVLHYNASCTVRPKFDAGTFHATVTRNGTTSNVTIVFSGCGQYTVTRS